MMELNTSEKATQIIQPSDFAKPLVLIISSFSRYQALVMVFLCFLIMSVFLLGSIWQGRSWAGVIVFGLMTLFCLKFLVDYWQAGSMPVVELDGMQLRIKGVVFNLHDVIAFDYKQDLMSKLIFNVTSVPQELAKAKQKPHGVGVIVLNNEHYFSLSIIVYIGRFSILGKKLKAEQIKSLVNEYIEYHKKHNRAIE